MRERESRVLVPRKVVTLLAPVLLVILVGCGSRAAGNAAGSGDASIDVCEAFEAAYGRCLGNLGSAEVAAARVAQLREALNAQAAGDESARAATRKKCVDNLADLQKSCR